MKIEHREGKRSDFHWKQDLKEEGIQKLDNEKKNEDSFWEQRITFGNENVRQAPLDNKIGN